MWKGLRYIIQLKSEDAAEKGELVKIGNRDFDFRKRCYIMGILNVTPDSFSDGGRWNDIKKAKAHVAEMAAQGADIIDVGGESTRPGHQQISAEEEKQRVIPIIEMIKSEFSLPVSIDSYKSDVVRAAIDAGADMVNDIWGLKKDEKLAKLIAESKLPCVLMHNRDEIAKHDFLRAYREDIMQILSIAKKAGIKKENIILDPGVGFGKTYEQNLMVINRLEIIKSFGCPVLLATSRKSVIGNTLDLPVDMRVEGTIATGVIGVLKGANLVRVHDVEENRRAILMAEAVLRENKM